jgi:hypothetical protein
VRSSSLAALCLLVLVAISAPAGATEEDSKTFFAQGRQLRAAGNCADAIVAFRRALEAFPQGLGALRNVAECEEQLGQFASARNDWWSLRRAVLLSNEPKYQGWDKDAEQGYARLAGKVAKITIRIHGADPAALTITIDGKPLDPRLVGVELERDLGPHIVQASYGGAAPVSEKRTLAAGANEVVTLEIPVQKNAPKATAAITARPPPPDAGNPGLRAAGIASIAVGGASAIATVIALAVRQSALSDFARCKRADGSYEGCPNDLQDSASTGMTASTLVNVFGILTIVGAGAGIPLLIASTPSSPAKPSARITAQANLMPLPGGGAARLEVRF